MKPRIVVIAVCAALVAAGAFAPFLLNGLFNLMDLLFGWADELRKIGSAR